MANITLGGVVNGIQSKPVAGVHGFGNALVGRLRKICQRQNECNEGEEDFFCMLYSRDVINFVLYTNDTAIFKLFDLKSSFKWRIYR